MTDETQITLRDSIANAVEAVEVSPVETPITTQEPEQTQETKEQRARDDQGRFAAEKAAKEAKIVTKDIKTEAAPKPAIQRPSSWKKDYWGHWDKMASGQTLTPEEARQIAEYSAQRESDFAKGVSTYKGEFDKAKSYMDAIAPIQPLLEQRGMNADQFLMASRHTFQTLSAGTDQQKIGLIFQLAKDYQVPLEQVFQQSEDGRFYLNPKAFQSMTQQSPPPQPDIRQVVKEMMMEDSATKQVEEFKSNTEQYPYLDQVRETMAGLLRAGLVEDLPSAYDAALKMPKHSDLYADFERQQREQAEQKQRAEASKVATQARAKAVSPRSSTPASTIKTEKGKGIRSVIEDAFNDHSGII